MGSTNDKAVKIGAIFASGARAVAKTVSTVDQIVWTSPKSPMPAQLAGRVPEDVWAATFDAVYAMTGKELDSQRAAMEQMGGLPMVPCCIPCIVCKAFASMGAVQEMAEELPGSSFETRGSTIPPSKGSPPPALLDASLDARPLANPPTRAGEPSVRWVGSLCFKKM